MELETKDTTYTAMFDPLHNIHQEIDSDDMLKTNIYTKEMI
jgi:hypothetical protein